MEDIVRFYREHGQLRSKPLLPANDPLASLGHLTSSRQWIYADPSLQFTNYFTYTSPYVDQEERAMLMEELLKLIDSVYHLPSDALDNCLPRDEPPGPVWQKIVSEVSTLKIRWDPGQNLYVFADGSHLPSPPKKIYQQAIWQLDGLGFNDCELTLARKNDDWLKIYVTRSQKAGAEVKPAILTLFSGDNGQALLTTFKFNDTKWNGGFETDNQIIKLSVGTKVQAILVINGVQTNSSPIYIP